MSNALKFLHASDLHLDRPISGIAEIPSHWKQPLANAPYESAERLFDLAIHENVDFVLLAGDIVDLDLGGPRSIAFLLGQFERLASKGIHVYWCGGSVDQTEHWPKAIELPSNVTTFPSSLVEQVVHTRGEKPVATILGASLDSQKRNPADFHCGDENIFAIALLHGELDLTGVSLQHIDYWALGGKHQRQVVKRDETTVVYPGTLQSRCPRETGSQGCTLVSVDTAGILQLQDMAVDTIRWTTQTLTVSESSKISELKECLGERALKLCNDSPNRRILVKWKIKTTGEFQPGLRKASLQREVLNWLRQEFGQLHGSLWTTSLDIEAPRSLPTEWYEEDTILGDYLRALSGFQGDTSMSLPLGNYLAETTEGKEWMVDLARLPKETRASILHRAALMGIDYLSAHELNSTDA